jgi:activator of HSP90 ATPase
MCSKTKCPKLNSIDDSNNSQPATPNSPFNINNNTTFINTINTPKITYNKTINIPKSLAYNKLYKTKSKVLDWCQNSI